MDKIFQRLIDGDLADLSGLTVDATITVSEPLANEIVILALEGNPQVEYCRLQIRPANQITLDVKSPRWPWPFKIKLKLFGSVDLTHSPTIRAFLENNVLLGKLGSLFKMLPDGIHFYEDQIAVDIGVFLNSREQNMLLDLIKTAEIRTEEGRMLIAITIQK
jgi:hypothetical protein